MAFTLPKIEYSYNALEPSIDAQTMEIHYSKHHAAYVEKLNTALESQTEMLEKDIETILKNINDVNESIRQAVINNGGGHANHTLFWKILTPGGAKEPKGELLDAISEIAGGFNDFKEKFSEEATKRFGSGWGWLVVNSEGKLEHYTTANQDSPLMQGHNPILGLDVWEHAYYLKYQNKRPDYIQAFWDVVNWDVVTELFEAAK